jgi:hypothetical protein
VVGEVYSPSRSSHRQGRVTEEVSSTWMFLICLLMWLGDKVEKVMIYVNVLWFLRIVDHVSDDV